MKTIIFRIYNYWPITVLFLVYFILIFKNYSPGTFLSGWDTLHPEFNFGLNLKRQIFGVFRLEQGLGTVSAHSHMADLPHTIILYILHFMLPMDLLRYSYIFLNLIIGPIGMYFFLYRVVTKKNKAASFLGSLFYLLNFGTMQQFIVPFEMFTTQYAILPWLFLFATEYIYSSKKKTLLLFAITTLLATPTAYAATLWYFYFLCFVLYIVSISLFDVFKKNYSIVKRSLMLVLITLFINSFWIFPNLYFIKTQGSLIQTGSANKIFSEEAFLYNKEFGNFGDIAFIKTFLFDWNVYDNNGFSKLLDPWIENLDKPLVARLGWVFAGIGGLGICYSVYKRNRVGLTFIPILLISIFFFINDNPPTGSLYRFLQNNVPLFEEALRFPQNKILGIFTFIYTIYFGFGQTLVTRLLISLSKKTSSISARVSLYTQIFVFFALLIIFMFPSFRGYLIHPQMRIQIPDSYFEMFKWFESQNGNGRIATLPIHSPWGWEYYRWHDEESSFQGAMFASFGIKQPILLRDFDRWTPYNEQHYREMSYAIYSQDASKLMQVLRKYNIRYILLDKSIIYPEQKDNLNILFLDEIETLLENASFMQKVFHSGNLLVYEVGISQNKNSYILKNPVSIASLHPIFYEDFAYTKYKDYISYYAIEKNDVFYPFQTMMNNENRFLFEMDVDGDNLKLTYDFGKQNITYTASILKDLVRNYDMSSVDKAKNDCIVSNTKKLLPQKEIITEKNSSFARYTSFSGSFCDHYSFADLPRDKGYLISIESRNIAGLPLRLCVTNYISRRCDIFTRVFSSEDFEENVFVVPPIDHGIGFDVNIENFAIKRSPSINDLKSIHIIPFPYSWFSKIEVDLYDNGELVDDKTILAFFRSFDGGWKAYNVEDINLMTQAFPFFFGKELKEHVLVNNWANGWVVQDQKSKIKDQKYDDSNSKIVIVFLPQYLEYLGFGVLIGTFVLISLKRYNTP